MGKNMYKMFVKFRGEMAFIFTSLLLSSLYILRTLTTFERLNFTIGQLALPVYMAGLDWSKLISKSDYYGYGFKWILIPLYSITDNPYYIYIGSILIYSLLYCIVGFWTYKVAKKYWGMSDKIVYALFFAMVFRIQDSIDAYTCEAPLLMMFFIVCIMTTYAIESPKRLLYSLLFPMILCYLITIHERAIAVTIAFIVIMVFYKMIYGKFFVNIPLFSIVYLLFFIVEKKMTAKLKLILYYGGLIGTNTNQSVLVEGDNLWFVKGIKQFASFMVEILSNILTLELHTLGISNFVIVGMFFIVFWGMFKKDILLQRVTNINKSIIIVLCLSFVTTFIVIGGMGVRWGRGISQESSYSYKGCGYYRYFLPFFWPAYLSMLVLLPKIMNIKILNYIKLISILFSSVLAVFWTVYLSRTLLKINDVNNEIHAERIGIFEYVTSYNYYEAVTISILITFTCVLLIALNREWSYKIYICIALVVTILNVTDNGKEMQIKSLERDNFYDIYEYVKMNEKDEEIPSDVYFYGSDFSIKKCQIILPRYTIDKYDKNNEEANIIFSWKSREEIGLGEEWTTYQLPNNAYVHRKK